MYSTSVKIYNHRKLKKEPCHGKFCITTQNILFLNENVNAEDMLIFKCPLVFQKRYEYDDKIIHRRSCYLNKIDHVKSQMEDIFNASIQSTNFICFEQVIPKYVYLYWDTKKIPLNRINLLEFTNNKELHVSKGLIGRYTKKLLSDTG